MNRQQILQKLNIKELNDMQQAACQAITFSSKDIVLLSPTGSGKTLAYLLPLVEKLSTECEAPQALVVVPSRELAIQSAMVLKSMGNGLRGCACYGGRTAMFEHKMLREIKPQIIFGTPGRLIDHMEKDNIKAESIHILVIDEFDKCLEMGFRNEMQHLLAILPRVEQHILLSATDCDDIPSFTDFKKAVRLSWLKDCKDEVDRVAIYQVHSPQKDKLETLDSLLMHLGQGSSIVFLNYRESVLRVNDFLLDRGYVTSCYHGGMDQSSREASLYKFFNGSANVLVSTDIASRGLDIPQIDNIIHYQLPANEQTYIHRIGRTARWDAYGRTFFILGLEEQLPQYVKATIDTYPLTTTIHKVPMPLMATLYFGKGKKDKISKADIVGFLCKKGGLKNDEIGRIDVRDRYSYVAVRREKVSTVLNQVQGEKIKGVHTLVEPVK